MTESDDHGWFDEDCTIRDSAGRLVAQSRQIARIPRVPTPTHTPN